MIYSGNHTVTTAKSASYLGNVGSNVNDFKPFNMKGVGGFIWEDDGDGDYESGEGLEGYTVLLWSVDGGRKNPGPQQVAEAITDEDGWYHIDYAHKGKAADYYIEVLDAEVVVETSDAFALGQGKQYEIFNWSDVDDDLVA